MADSNDLRGALFKNDRKEKDSHPDYRGDITIEGQKFWLSGWIKEGKKGKYLSLAAKPADEQRASAQASGEPTRGGGSSYTERDEIPFGPEVR
jgi:hypothetical protein